MNWDLYVDESGSFDADTPCLIGGYMVPHGSFTSSMPEQWKNHILMNSEICALSEEYRKATGKEWYFNHCKENKNVPARWKLETAILKKYKELFSGIGGKLIVFDCPSGLSNSDNTTNFLTVMAKGVFALFHEQYVEGSVVRLHMASRKNITNAAERDLLPVSPTAVWEPGLTDERIIIAEQYRRQLRNMAYLAGGADLADNKEFCEMLDTLEIVRDQRVIKNGVTAFVEDPSTVICDYICNLYYSRKNRQPEIRNEIVELLTMNGSVVFNTEAPLYLGTHFEKLLGNRDYGTYLFRLFCHDFPVAHTEGFFKQFNTIPESEQFVHIQHFIELMRKPVEQQLNMKAYNERFKKLEKVADDFTDEQVRLTLIANILLYRLSLNTHLGRRDETKDIINQFETVVNQITDGKTADELIEINNNQMLVNYTDDFAYEDAEDFFNNHIRPEWSARLNGRHKDNIYVAYGRTLGSYLQLLRHRMHSAHSSDDCELFYMEAQELYSDAEKHLITNADKSRFHQNVCDIETEAGHYSEALRHLYLSSVLINDNQSGVADPDAASYVVETAGVDGANMPYMLQHFLRLTATMELNGADAEELLKNVLPMIDENYGSKVHQIHPRTQIQWKAASCLAGNPLANKDQRNLAKKLYDTAYRQLYQEGTRIFSAIAVAVKAEEMYFVKKGILKADVHNMLIQINLAYAAFKSMVSEDAIDPFSDFRSDDSHLLKEIDPPERFLELSRIIGY